MTETKDMIQCTKWYHLNVCANVSEDIIVKKDIALVMHFMHSPTPSETSLILQNVHQPQTPYQHYPHPKSKPLIKPTPRKCGQKNCATCQHFNTKQYFRSTVTKRCFRVKGNYSCNSTNIIYLITCKKCMKQYVGLTTKTLRERINHHRSTIIRKMKRYISSHFSLPDHNINDLTVQIIDSTPPNSLAQTEQFWINTLKTTQPLGLNCIKTFKKGRV